MKTKIFGIVSALVALMSLATGCGQSQTSSENSSSQRPLSPREEALATYLDVQKAIADGNFEQFKQYLSPEFTAAANSGALTPEFQQLTVQYGASLATFFSGNADFQLDDEEGRDIRIAEMFQYKTGLVQKWPNKELLARVDELCAIMNEIATAHWIISPANEEKIKNMAAKCKDEMVALAVKEGEDAATVGRQWDAKTPHDLLEAISHYVQDRCAFDYDGDNSSKPRRPNYRIDIGRWFPDMQNGPKNNNTKLNFRFTNEDGDVGQEFTLQRFDDGLWKIVLNP